MCIERAKIKKMKNIILLIFINFYISNVFAQKNEYKISVIPISRKTLELNIEHYLGKKISLEVMPSVGYINPVQKATAGYWYRPRLGVGAGIRYYWTKPQQDFHFYTGIISRHSIQYFGTKNQKIKRIEQFTGLNTGLKIKLNHHYSIELSTAFSPIANKQFQDLNSNTEIDFVSRGTTSTFFPSFDFSLPKGFSFAGNLFICYRF